MIEATLVFPVDYGNQKILLGCKKKGFGLSKWNGFGGKIQGEEEIDAAAERELAEECSLLVSGEHLVYVADHEFYFPSKPELDMRVHTYTVDITECIGKPSESDEMLPRWFKFNQIPYAFMWPDDQHWLPLVLYHGAKDIRGKFIFKDNCEDIAEFKVDCKFPS